MKRKVITFLAATTLLMAGCQPLSVMTSNTTKNNATQQTSPSTFDEVIKHTQANPLQGKVIAEMKNAFDPSLNKLAFITLDEKTIFVYQENYGTTRVVIVKPDGTSYDHTFEGYQLKRAILNNKILYIGFKGDQAIKLNTDSYDYSEVDKSELDRARVVIDEMVLPDKETPVYTSEGYVYTKEGVIFDIKNNEYLNKNGKHKYYDNADFGYGDNLFELQPRLDQAVNLRVIKAKGDETELRDSYGIQLDLPKGYDVKNIVYTLGKDGHLVLFAPGVTEDQKTVIKMFEIPIGSYKDASNTNKDTKDNKDTNINNEVKENTDSTNK